MLEIALHIKKCVEHTHTPCVYHYIYAISCVSLSEMDVLSYHIYTMGLSL